MKDRRPTFSGEPVAAVGGVVYRKNRRNQIELLLIKKEGGLWSLPKGHIEQGETHSGALLREIHEETGISGSAEQRLCAVSYTILKGGSPRTKIVTYYLVRATGGRPKPSKKEHIARVKWFALATAQNRIKRARLRAIIQQATALLTDGTTPAL
ncbi:NUDIX hydrolase [Chloroflexia bacterium SDU3-3]|nr:NUDIX hydrolase [Chloroflexia bacterium SDU3-3]